MALSISYCLQGLKLKPLLVNEKCLQIQFLFGRRTDRELFLIHISLTAWPFDLENLPQSNELWPTVLSNLLEKSEVSDKCLETEENMV